MTVGKSGIIRSMVHIYTVYRFVKLIDEENNKAFEKAMIQINKGNHDISSFRAISELDACELLGNQRVLFKKRGPLKANRAGRAAVKCGYIEVIDKNKTDSAETNYLRVSVEKGSLLIDGGFFFRPGLWKAWYDEHGWITAIPLLGIGLGVGHVGWTITSKVIHLIPAFN